MNSAPPRSWVAQYIRPLSPLPTHTVPRGALRPPVDCLLCDIYGTLFISGCGDVGTAPEGQVSPVLLQALLDQYGIPQSPDQLTTRLHAAILSDHRSSQARGIVHPEMRIDEIWSRLLPFASAADLQRFAVAYEMIVNPVWPMPGLRTLLSHCRQSGMRLGIISNAQFFTPWLFDWFLGACLTQLGFDADLILLSHHFGRAKPDPFLFKTAATRLWAMGIPVQRTAYIGNDMRKDVLPAHKAGFQTILFAGDARSLRLIDPQCTLPADRVVTDLAQAAASL
ncbi:MAG: HAD family hydrolase [Desulfatitalea sp.]|nr:HAD family hydrolase [Desulfatitalea sp.]NNK01829.1 HAD family hydrolase [Desulfatitalea sp.]